MRIGIISDSHGQRDLLAAAVSALVGRGAQAVVHCGDFADPDDLALLWRPGLAAYAVAGNMDKHHLDDLADRAEAAHVAFSTELVTVDLGRGRALAATHGHDESLLEELIAGQQFPYICHGHTHSIRDERFGPVRVINPGALHHSRRPGYPTVALLDSETDDLAIFRVGAVKAAGR